MLASHHFPNTSLAKMKIQMLLVVVIFCVLLNGLNAKVVRFKLQPNSMYLTWAIYLKTNQFNLKFFNLKHSLDAPIPSQCMACPRVSGIYGCKVSGVGWYYSQDQKRCVQYFEASCKPSANDFSSLESCEATCVPRRGWENGIKWKAMICRSI